MFPYSAVCTALYVANTWKEACHVMLCSKPSNFQELPKHYFDKHETDHLCILQSMVKKKNIDFNPYFVELLMQEQNYNTKNTT